MSSFFSANCYLICYLTFILDCTIETISLIKIYSLPHKKSYLKSIHDQAINRHTYTFSKSPDKIFIDSVIDNAIHKSIPRTLTC